MKPDDNVKCVPSDLLIYATIHSIGIEWHLTGDTDHDATCEVRYRAKGSKQWKRALPLMRVDFYGWYDDDKADRPYNMLAGSILFLRPGTVYDVKLALTDPDGARVSRNVTIATRPIPRVSGGGNIYHVVPGSGREWLSR